jgi:hypothetical protein
MLIGYAELTVSPLKLQHTGSDRSVLFPHLSSWSSDVIWPCRFSQVADFPVRQLRGRRTQDTCKSSEYIFNYTDCLEQQDHSTSKTNVKNSLRHFPPQGYCQNPILNGKTFTDLHRCITHIYTYTIQIHSVACCGLVSFGHRIRVL